jgi:integrase
MSDLLRAGQLASDIEPVATVAERIANMDKLAGQYIADHRPENTKTAYDADWKVWQEYCSCVGIPETTATTGALVGLVRWLEIRTDEEGNPRPAAPNTIERRLAGAVVGLRERGVEAEPIARKKAREALKDYRRRLAEGKIKRGRGKAPAARVNHLRVISEACPDTLAGKRDRALTLLGFAVAARRSELAALHVEEIEEAEEGLLVHILWSKTSPRDVRVLRGEGERTCPVRAWMEWKQAAGITQGPAFRRINRHDKMLEAGLSGQAVGAIITRVAQRAGLTVRFTGHSVRAGLATEARRAGHDPKTIATQGGWVPNGSALYGYMQVVDGWTDNALKGIGL